VLAVGLTKEINFRKIDNLVTASAQNSFEHEQAESGGLLQRNCRRHRQLLAMNEHFDQRRSVVLERLLQHRSHIFCDFRFQAEMPALCASAAKSGFFSSTPKSRKPPAFISNSTNESESFLKTTTFTGNSS
jgi:hypothetical protein